MRRKMAAGNWKMNGSLAALEMIGELSHQHASADCDIVICPPALFLTAAVERAGQAAIGVGAQDCHTAASGAHTGDIAAGMIAATGASHVIVGHSERRETYGETNAIVCDKAAAAQAAALIPIVCIGESLSQRESGEALPVIRAQLANSVPEGSTGDTLVVAYEPIWAIGTGKIPSMEEIAEVHTALRTDLVDRFGEDGNSVRLLYGGSVKPGNAADIFALPDVDGALVGGASLKTDDFSPIVAALDAS